MSGLTDIEMKELLTKLIDSESQYNFVGLLLETMEDKINNKEFGEIDVLFNGLYLNYRLLSEDLVQMKEMVDK